MSYKISVIVPIYNVADYILSCLSSVVNQTITEGIECILVDDCGMDDSIQIAENLINNYKGKISFVVLRHERNLGLSAARNTGIKQAKGEYLLFLDSDDELLPNAIECFLRVLSRHHGIDMIQGAYESEAMGHCNGLVLPKYTNNRKEIKDLMLDYNKLPIMAQNRLVRRNLIESNNLYFKEGIIHEDCYWTYFLAKHVHSLACIHEKTYFYRVNPNSIMGNPNVEKETYSFRIIIEDFSAHIDKFQEGAQKNLIGYLLLQTIENRYFNGADEKRHLFMCLYNECRWYEKPLMRYWYSLPHNSSLKTKMFHLLLRVFRLS